mmetsp:Transcript_93408/g.261285  ORF Transcript_93408/g.261285 Transcript_93408/m.261285 type:complete len:245 (+) Transcript_93408:389-1123(+)
MLVRLLAGPVAVKRAASVLVEPAADAHGVEDVTAVEHGDDVVAGEVLEADDAALRQLERPPRLRGHQGGGGAAARAAPPGLLRRLGGQRAEGGEAHGVLVVARLPRPLPLGGHARAAEEDADGVLRRVRDALDEAGTIPPEAAVAEEACHCEEAQRESDAAVLNGSFVGQHQQQPEPIPHHLDGRHDGQEGGQAQPATPDVDAIVAADPQRRQAQVLRNPGSCHSAADLIQCQHQLYKEEYPQN